MHFEPTSSLVRVVHDTLQLFLTMIKNLTTNQLLLIALAAVLLVIAAFSFYLLQNPTAPLPFVPLPATGTPTPISIAADESTVQNTPTPTRRISYTPLFAFATPALGTPSVSTTQLITPTLGTPSAPPHSLSPLGKAPILLFCLIQIHLKLRHLLCLSLPILPLQPLLLLAPSAPHQPLVPLPPSPARLLPARLP